MFRHLIKKEVLNNITDFRFMISSIIALCLVVLTTVILSEQYMKQVDQYKEFISSDKAALGDVKVFSELVLNAHRPPNPLVIFNSGLSQQLDNSVRITHAAVPRQGLETESENPFMNIFRSADLATIFLVVFSLLAILLVYDAISGEREDGTLIAMLGNSVPRDQILISKFLAGFLGITISMFVSLLVSLLIMQIFYGITFNGAQWLRIILIILSSFVFLGFFLAVGLLVSTRSRTASISLIWLLFIWVFTVIIQPNLGSYLGSAAAPIPPRERIESAIGQVWEEYRTKWQEINVKIIEEVPGEAWHSDHSDNWPYYICFEGNRPALLRYVLRTQRLQPLWASYAEKEYRLYQEEYERSLNRQFKYQNLFNYLAPAAMYRRISSALAESDINHHDLFMDNARQFRQTFLSYLTNDRKIFSENAYLYFTQQNRSQIENSNYIERMDKKKRGESVVSFSRNDCGPLDLNDLPQFSLQTTGIGQSLRFVLIDFSILVILTVILFYLCVVSFHQCDVRQNS